ncbi:hypothetical protein [Gottschalkia acidurici]|uniref:hypothetical protein n=1 Tax=Clostridium acidurici TaxID=1556 RepID=UPI001186316D|nr:hypothetical protein [Gottschalkia acidurici]
MNQTIFVKDGKVICHLHGNPENTGIGFNFGTYLLNSKEGRYISFMSKSKLSFKITVSENGIRYFEYVK